MASSPIPVAFLLDQNAVCIDFIGPWEVFRLADQVGGPSFQLYTVGPTRAPLTCAGGMVVEPAYGFADAPQPKLVIIPAQDNNAAPAKLDWIRKVSRHTEVTASVCLGAFVLASTGLLDGKRATTHHLACDQLAKEFPKVQVVRDVRYVDDGRLATGAGLSSGIDLGLHLLARLSSEEVANADAALVEYRRGSKPFPS